MREFTYKVRCDVFDDGHREWVLVGGGVSQVRAPGYKADDTERLETELVEALGYFVSELAHSESALYKLRERDLAANA